MLAIKIILLQVFWYAVVYTSWQYQELFFVVSLFLAAMNYFIFLKHIKISHYFITLLVFIGFGVYEIVGASLFGFIDYQSSTFSLWLLSLYVVFICYYGDVFNYLSSKPLLILIVMGLIGGPLAFMGGVKIADLSVKSNFYYLFISINWGVFFPLSIKLFYKPLS